VICSNHLITSPATFLVDYPLRYQGYHRSLSNDQEPCKTSASAAMTGTRMKSIPEEGIFPLLRENGLCTA
jgi:hypothetical protein